VRPTIQRRPHALLCAAALASAALLLASPALAASGGLSIFPDFRTTLPILIALFLLLIWPANRVLWQPMLRVLDERSSRIEGARDEARSLGVEADEVLGRYEAAVGEARSEAETGRRGELDQARREQARIGNEARGEAEGEISRAREEVAAALENARSELRTQAESLAREAANRVLGRSLS